MAFRKRGLGVCGCVRARARLSLEGYGFELLDGKFLPQK